MEAKSGQIEIAIAGTAVQGPDEIGNLFVISPHPDNETLIPGGATVFVGRDENDTVTSSTGYPLKSLSTLYLYYGNLQHVAFNANANGARICWIRVR